MKAYPLGGDVIPKRAEVCLPDKLTYDSLQTTFWTLRVRYLNKHSRRRHRHTHSYIVISSLINVLGKHSSCRVVCCSTKYYTVKHFWSLHLTNNGERRRRRRWRSTPTRTFRRKQLVSAESRQKSRETWFNHGRKWKCLPAGICFSWNFYSESKH